MLWDLAEGKRLYTSPTPPPHLSCTHLLFATASLSSWKTGGLRAPEAYSSTVMLLGHDPWAWIDAGNEGVVMYGDGGDGGVCIGWNQSIPFQHTGNAVRLSVPGMKKETKCPSKTKIN